MSIHCAFRAFALALALSFATLLAPAAAHAQSAVHASSDALYVGLRAEPGVAYAFAYDLDILVTDTQTGITIGPSVSIAFGSDSSADLGRRQEYLIAADFLRARVTLGQTYGFRGMALLGAGMYLAALYEQRTELHPAMLPDGTTVMVSELHPWALLPGALLTGGVAADWYFDSHWGLAVYLVGHVRLDDQNRIPAVWVEAGLGMRWGE